MNAIPVPIAANGSSSRQIGVLGVISTDSQANATASVANPKPMIGRGWDRSTSLPTNGASTPVATAIGAVNNAAPVGLSPHTVCA
jgi:hypothetical protein